MTDERRTEGGTSGGKASGEQDRLIEALARQVPFEGWGDKALAHAAEAEGIDPVLAADLLPGGAREQVLAFAAWADRQMTAAVAAAAPPAEGERPGIRERIAQALKARFEVLEGHREAVRRGLTVLALPHNAAAGLAALHRTSDAVWTALGDSSTDWNWYSKRLLLAGVISATTLYWLEDKSEGHERSWAFLDRQLERVVQIGGKLGQAVKRALSFPDRLLAKGMKAARKSYGA